MCDLYHIPEHAAALLVLPTYPIFHVTQWVLQCSSACHATGLVLMCTSMSHSLNGVTPKTSTRPIPSHIFLCLLACVVAQPDCFASHPLSYTPMGAMAYPSWPTWRHNSHVNWLMLWLHPFWLSEVPAECCSLASKPSP